MNKFYSFILAGVILSLNINAQSPNWQWAKSAGGTDQDYVTSSAIDAAGNVYVTGYFYSTSILFDSVNLLSDGSIDIFLVKYNSSGNVVWVTTARGTDADMSNGITVDLNGNIYIVGFFKSDSITFGSTTLINKANPMADIFIAKFDSSGNALMAKSAGCMGNDNAISVVADQAGNIFVSGLADSSGVVFGSDTLANAGMFIVKYDSSGNSVYAVNVGDNSNAYPYSIALDSHDNIFAAGIFYSPTISFGTNTLLNTGTSWPDPFLVKCDTVGNPLWAKGASGIDWEGFEGISTDLNGNVFVTGESYSDTIRIDTVTIINSNYNLMFLIKYDAYGNMIWVLDVEGAAGWVVKNDILNNIYTAGSYGGTVSFGSISLTASGGSESIYIAKYDSSGNILFAKSIDDTLNCWVASANVDASGVYVTGNFQGTPAFGSTTLSSEGSYDLFVAKLDTQLVTGYDEIKKSVLTLLVYPNPASDEITIQLPGDIKKSKVEIFNAVGKNIFTFEIERDKTISVHQWENGIYIMKVSSEKYSTASGFIIMH